MRRLPSLAAALSAIVTCVLAVALVLAPTAARAAAVVTELQPAHLFVAPGADFEIDLVLPVAGDSLFNGFSAVVKFDPAALTFVQAVPLTAQQGCLMTGGCSAACGTTFHSFRALGDSLAAGVALLCDTTFVRGPGQLYRYHFRASNTDQVTNVTTRTVQFLKAGIYVNPATTTNSVIEISSLVGVEGGPGGPAALRLGAEPNPTQGPVAFSIAAVEDGVQALDVLDLSGRMVRHLSSGWQPRGSRRLSWDGTDSGGGRLPAGVYLVRLRAGAHTALTRVTIVR
jgi:hypothetical protein